MKKLKKVLLILVLFVGLFIFAGCEKDPAKDFKNPKEITVKGDKGNAIVTYDDDGSYEEDESGNEKILKSSDNGFRLSLEFQTLTVSDAKTRESNFKKDSNYTVISDVEYRGSKGFVIVNNKYADAQVYLYLDEENDVVFLVKVGPMRTNEVLDEIAKGKKPEDILYKNETVQQILKTVKYEKNK